MRIIEASSAGQVVQARELFEEYARSLGFSLCFQGFDKELAGLPGEYAPPSGRLLLAEADGKIAGCVALHALPQQGPDACEVKRLFVGPEYRGQKVGRRLMDAVLDEARRIGYGRMLLDTVSGKMDTAIAMYRDYGFREVTAYRKNPQPGVLYMELDLTPCLAPRSSSPEEHK